MDNKGIIGKDIIQNRVIKHFLYNLVATIPEVAKSIGYSVPSVTKQINALTKKGIIQKKGKVENVEGRPPTLYGLSSTAGYFLGIDICRNELNLGLMSLSGKIVDSKFKIPFTQENTKACFDEVCKQSKNFISSVKINPKKILMAGVNITGRVDPKSGDSYSLFNFFERPVADVFTENLGIPTCIENDTRAMTYGEKALGIIGTEKEAIFINISWGLGAGLVINGKIHSGHSGFSGEFGHSNVLDNEIICHCGKKGCLETEVSGAALYRMVIERIHEGKSSVLSEKVNRGEEISQDDILSAIIKEEDVLCIECIEEIGEKLGRHLSGLINLLNPKLVVIGGALSLTGDYILQPIKTAIRRHALNLVTKDTEIVISTSGEKLGILGACVVARNRAFQI